MPALHAPRMFADAVGAVPMSPAVLNAYWGALAEGWADPRRQYKEADRARAMLDDAREELASHIGSSPAHTHFAPTPAVSAERIVLGIAAARRGRLRAIASAAESASMLAAARHVSGEGFIEIPVDREARLDLDEFSRAVAGHDIAFAAVQHANGEVGTLQPLEDAHAAALVAKVPLVVDATSTIGWLTPPTAWDALIANPANWGGPSGLGILALRPGLRWLPAWPNGAPWAPGSVNIPAAIAATTALRFREAERSESLLQTVALAQALRVAIAAIPDSIILGHPRAHLPHVVTANFVYCDAGKVAALLDSVGIAVGAGCSCGGDPLSPCPTLVAMGSMVHGTVRFGLSPGLDHEDIARLTREVATAVAAVRTQAGAPR